MMLMKIQDRTAGDTSANHLWITQLNKIKINGISLIPPDMKPSKWMMRSQLLMHYGKLCNKNLYCRRDLSSEWKAQKTSRPNRRNIPVSRWTAKSTRDTWKQKFREIYKKEWWTLTIYVKSRGNEKEMKYEEYSNDTSKTFQAWIQCKLLVDTCLLTESEQTVGYWSQSSGDCLEMTVLHSVSAATNQY